MNCKKCGAPVSDTSAFCSECGTKIVRIDLTKKFCSECGAQMKPDARFCSECGYDSSLIRYSVNMNAAAQPTVEEMPAEVTNEINTETEIIEEEQTVTEPLPEQPVEEPTVEPTVTEQTEDQPEQVVEETKCECNDISDTDKCIKCGTDLNGMRFCINCGNDSQAEISEPVIEPEPAVQPEPTVQPEPAETNQNESNNMNIAFCLKCGAPLVAGFRFCTKCGFDTASVKIENIEPKQDNTADANIESPKQSIRPAFCLKCGTKLKDDDVFCIGCGKKIE